MISNKGIKIIILKKQLWYSKSFFHEARTKALILNDATGKKKCPFGKHRAGDEEACQSSDERQRRKPKSHHPSRHSVNKIYSKEKLLCFWTQGSLKLRNAPTQGLASNSLIFLSWSPFLRPRTGICESPLSTPDFLGRKKQLLPNLTHSSDVDELISLPLL